MRAARTSAVSINPEGRAFGNLTWLQLKDMRLDGLMMPILNECTNLHTVTLRKCELLPRPGAMPLSAHLHTLVLVDTGRRLSPEELQPLSLAEVLPMASSACPRLRQLEVRASKVTSPPDGQLYTAAACQQLTALTTSRMGLVSAQDANGTITDSFQQQLRALPSLASIQVHHHPQPTGISALADIATAAPHITELVFTLYVGKRKMGYMTDDFDPLLPYFPQLQKLQLGGAVVTDQCMRALLDRTSLCWVGVRAFEVAQDWSMQPCTWRVLALEDLSILQLSRLPLANELQLQSSAYNTARLIVDTPDLATVSQVVQAVRSLGGVRWLCKAVQLKQQDSNSACVLEVLPLLATCGDQQLSDPWCELVLVTGVGSITPQLLHMMYKQLVHRGVKHVHFQLCVWAPDAWSALLPNLPERITHVRLGHGITLTEEQFLAVCSNATRTVTLQVKAVWRQWAEGWEDRVDAATLGCVIIKTDA